MASTKEIGQNGEDLAQKFLLAKGYTLIHKNYRFRKSEIDLIFQDQHTLVFVEVKYRSQDDFGQPEEGLQEAQQARILSAAEQYTWKYHWDGPIRFDIVAILAKNQELEITHFEDAFY